MTITSKKNILTYGCMAFLSMILTACTSVTLNVSNPMVLPAFTNIVVGPIANNSDTPLANRQVETMSVGILQSHGFRNVKQFPRRLSCEKLLYCPDDGMTQGEVIRWGRAHHVPYVLTGAVNEWRYKVGLDGEPVAGVSLFLINTSSGKIVWSGVGSIIGGTRLGLDVVGQRLLNGIFASFLPTGPVAVVVKPVV